ncbi:MAG: aspartate-semialdehyde dehydrogenase [Candidatus Eisenbacteria bacterium]|nr:aspartate-semialdehyde dehydrogenase [Candidatus Eisenbacteria bacterium]
MSRTVAILGATGMVGRTMLSILEQRAFPLDDLRLLASERSADRVVRFRDRDVAVQPVSERAFDGVSIALFATSAELSRQWAPIAQAAGAVVVDNSSAFRMEPNVPLVVPEVNGAELERRPTLIANANCVAIPLVMTLQPLRALATLQKVVVSSYQSVSGAGAEALDELERGVRAGLDGPPPPRTDGRPAFAYNVLPHIDKFDAEGWTGEERKIINETRRMLDLPALAVTPTSVRVPVRVGHSAAVVATFDRPLEPEDARAAWRRAPGVRVVDDPATERYPTPLEAAGLDDVLVGRTRRDPSDANALVWFLASDNLRKGAALNAVQIAERIAAGAATTR